MGENNNEQRIKEIDAELDKVYAEVDEINNRPIDKNETFEQYRERQRPFNERISKLSTERRMIMPYTLSPLSDYGDVMPLSGFIDACKCGMFIDYDGHGYYVKDNQETDIKIIPSDVAKKKIRNEFDTIIWFNR